MSQQLFRFDSGGDIDRTKPLTFTFNDVKYTGYQGDTLASALLANGVHLIGRSFKYHRPRGIYASGCDDPNAKVQLVFTSQRGTINEPNVNATELELVEGLTAHSQNCWPSVKKDIGAINNVLKHFFPAGFYYKTFMWPAKFWHRIYEPFIRNAAGLGVVPKTADATPYNHYYEYCDLLIIGSGYAGINYALQQTSSDINILLVEDKPRLGGKLLLDNSQSQWLQESIAQLQVQPNVTIKTRTQACGYYDQNMVTLIEQVNNHEASDNPHTPLQRMWYVRAKQVVIASGAIERPLLFANNDRPGIFLASAAREYLELYSVTPGRKPLIFTNNDSAYTTALAFKARNIEPVVIDVREKANGALVQQARDSNIDIRLGFAIANTLGNKRVSGAIIGKLNSDNSNYTQLFNMDCDCICVSGHWTPTVHLASHAGNKLKFNETIHSFIPDNSLQGEIVIGEANGEFDQNTDIPYPLWRMPLPSGSENQKQFVDLQNDVATSDLALAVRENFKSIEHVKRYTTLGMATDQGKTSNLNGLQYIADILGKSVPEVGHTTFRPPYNPMSIGAIVGGKCDEHYMPIRRTPMHHWHQDHGGVMQNVGLWQRPKGYLQTGESIHTATIREASNVRQNVGICDVTSLGKIDIQGSDAAEFLSRVYINNWLNLPVGKARYGVMIREDGAVFDDGTTTRIANNHFHMTTTTAQAGPVMTHLEYYLQVVWPELDVQIVSTTEQWAGISIAGPKSRQLIQSLFPDEDLSNEDLPFMGYKTLELDDNKMRIFRISFSGELAYELNIGTRHGLWLWEKLLTVGAPLGVQPYGTEALQTLRIEMGHVAGSEIDGRHNLVNLGLEGLVSKQKDFIGKRSLQKTVLSEPTQGVIMGIVPICKKTMIPEGSYLVTDPKAPVPIPKIGYITSSCWSVEHNYPFSLAIVNNGKQRLGQLLYAVSPLENISIAVNVVSSHHVDSKGERVRS